MKIQNVITKKYLTKKGPGLSWTNEGTIFTPEELKEMLNLFNNKKAITLI